jgi:putative transposase
LPNPAFTTLHRWRKQPALVATPGPREPDRTRGTDDWIAELQLENSRLRRLVTDLLLEKIKVEDAAQIKSSPRRDVTSIPINDRV